MTKYITEEGLARLKKELEVRLGKRSQIARRIEEAKSLGDLSENADYIKAKEEQSFNEGKIREIQTTLMDAEVIKKNHGNNHRVVVNTLIRVEDEKKKLYEYNIVGAGEADPLQGKISYESPLGKKFFNKKVGDIVTVDTPGGKKVYKIVEIE